VAIEADPNATLSAPVLLQLGNEYVNIGESEVALELYEQALQLDSSRKIPVLLARGKIYGSQEKWDLALECFEQILELDPNHFDALNFKIACLNLLARTDEEVAALRRILALRPNLQMHSRLLFAMLYVADTTPESVYDESRRWFELYGAPLARNTRSHGNDPDPNRKIKIAYLSPDLRVAPGSRYHTIMKLLPAVFDSHDHAQLDVSFYSIGSLEGNVSEHLAETNRVVQLRPSPDEIAAQARADEIDILIDLAGHTMEAAAHLVFAMKPAPLQVSWLGMNSTTGMPTIDYYVGDAHSPCRGTEHLFSETVYRLPRVYCSYRPTADIGIAESPFFRNGYITFGSFNDPSKITRDVIKLWSVILHLAPGSKLFLNSVTWKGRLCSNGCATGCSRTAFPLSVFALRELAPPSNISASGAKWMSRSTRIHITVKPPPSTRFGWAFRW